MDTDETTGINLPYKETIKPSLRLITQLLLFIYFVSITINALMNSLEQIIGWVFLVITMLFGYKILKGRKTTVEIFHTSIAVSSVGERMEIAITSITDYFSCAFFTTRSRIVVIRTDNRPGRKSISFPLPMSRPALNGYKGVAVLLTNGEYVIVPSKNPQKIINILDELTNKNKVS